MFSDKPGALLNQSDFFKNLLDHMQIGVIVADADGYIIYINETYERFLNIDAQTQIGKHATEVIANTRLHIVARTGVAEVNYPHEFKSHDWPGNARELLNVVEQILVSLEGETIQQVNLPFYISKKESPVISIHSTLKDYLHEAEKTFIDQALEAAGQNRSRAARRLGIHRTLLYRNMKKLGLTDFRPRK